VSLNFSRTDSFDIASPLDKTISVDVYGEDTTYTLEYRTGKGANCLENTPTSSAEFCGATDVFSSPIWAHGSIVERDNHALKRFSDLVYRFTNCKNGNCNYYDERCELSNKCLELLRQFSCEEAFPSCNDQGFKKDICKSTCVAIEQHCAKSFIDVALEKYVCDAAIYRSDCPDRSYASILFSSLIFVIIAFLM